MKTAIDNSASKSGHGSGKTLGSILVVIGVLMLFTIIIPYFGIMMAIPGFLFIFAGLGLIAFRSKNPAPTK